VTKLKDAQASLDDGRTNAAWSQLGAFTKLGGGPERQSDRPADAEALIAPPRRSATRWAVSSRSHALATPRHAQLRRLEGLLA